MKRSMAIDDIADRELAAADQMMTALASTAPGYGGNDRSAGWRLGRSLPGIHPTSAGGNDAAPRHRVGGSGRATERVARRFARETRDKLTQMNR